MNIRGRVLVRRRAKRMAAAAAAHIINPCLSLYVLLASSHLLSVQQFIILLRGLTAECTALIRVVVVLFLPPSGENPMSLISLSAAVNPLCTAIDIVTADAVLTP